MSIALAGAVIIGTLVTAVDGISHHDPMSDKLETAVAATRRQGAHGAFKAIEDMPFTTQADLKALSIVIPTHFTTDASLLSSNGTHKYPH
jgi:CTP:molybdopterin cytidylyltransferase MocA